VNGRTIARLAATAAVFGVGAAATLGSTVQGGPGRASADPATSPLDVGIDQLTTAAGTDPTAQSGVTLLGKTARLISAAKLDRISGGFQPFWFAAPTVGCGGGFPVTMTVFSGVSGAPGPDRGDQGGTGTVHFEATPAMSGYPTGSGLTVAWLNTQNGRSSITPLDDQTDYRLPSLSKTVDTGTGTVVAVTWGTIDYPGSTCVVTPTVGVVTVSADPAPDPAAPSAPLGVVPPPSATSQAAVPGDAPSGPAAVPNTPGTAAPPPPAPVFPGS
jgi:hypothetical protein